MKYKVGDKVKIKEDLVFGGDYKAGVTEGVLKFRGKIGVIEEIEFDENYIITGFDGWSWSEDMIEGKIEFGNEVDGDKMKKSLVECELSIGTNDVKVKSDCFYLNSDFYKAEEVDDLIELLQETKKIYEQFNV
jgi:hypothetical protein